MTTLVLMIQSLDTELWLLPGVLTDHCPSPLWAQTHDIADLCGEGEEEGLPDTICSKHRAEAVINLQVDADKVPVHESPTVLIIVPAIPHFQWSVTPHSCPLSLQV